MLEAHQYDRSEPLDVQIEALPEEGNDVISVHTLSYASPRGGRVPALLVLPAVPGRCGGVLFFHFGGRQTRAGFIAEATRGAKAGLSSLFVDAPWLRPGLKDEPHLPHAARFFEQAAVDLLRAAEVLAALPEIDAEQIAFVGHGFGAHLGAVLAARSPELKAAVLITGSPRMSHQMIATPHPFWKRPGISPSELRAAAAQMAEIDAERFIGESRVPVFHQYANTDPFVTEDEARRYFSLTPHPKLMRFYEGDQGLNNPLAQLDRLAFLRAAIRSPRPANGQSDEDRRRLSEDLSRQLPPWGPPDAVSIRGVS